MRSYQQSRAIEQHVEVDYLSESSRRLFLLRSQGLHGLNAGCATGRESAGYEGAEDEDSAGGEDGADVIAVDLVEL